MRSVGPLSGGTLGHAIYIGKQTIPFFFLSRQEGFLSACTISAKEKREALPNGSGVRPTHRPRNKGTKAATFQRPR